MSFSWATGTHYSVACGVQSNKVTFDGVNRYSLPSGVVAIRLCALTCKLSSDEMGTNWIRAEVMALIFWPKYSLLRVSTQTPATPFTVPAASC